MLKSTRIHFLFFSFLLPFLFCFYDLQAVDETSLLKGNLAKAKEGEYLITQQCKNFSALVVQKIEGDLLDIHEISIPEQRLAQRALSWKKWLADGAPGNTSWLLYRVHIPSGTIQHTYSYTCGAWITSPQTQNFLTTLLNLKFTQIPTTERKRIGHSPPHGRGDARPLWQPPMIVEGQKVAGVPFKAWRTHWPKDGSELSNRIIEVYIPEESEKYPTYFPYWLQISGMFGKAKVHIVDSGSGVRLEK